MLMCGGREILSSKKGRMSLSKTLTAGQSKEMGL